MTWEEIYELTYSKLKENIKKEEITSFKNWFMEREKLGYCFDYFLVYRCFKIWKELKNNLDHFVVISGREGLGKSTLAIQMMSWIYPELTLDNVTYNAEGFIDLLSKKAETEGEKEITGIILDEGTELLSRESFNLTNRTLTKSFFIQRALKFCVIICIPNFHMLDSVVKNHRVRTLIEVIARGKYKAITGEGIKLVAKYGKDNKEVNGIKIPNGKFWNGYFNKDFPNTLKYEEYEKHKLSQIKEALSKMKGETIRQKLIPTSKVAKELGVAVDVVTRMIQSGKVRGLMIGNRRYIRYEDYENLPKLLEIGVSKPI